jgi:hypothetical protein
LFGGALGLAILAAIATSRTKSALHQDVVGGMHAALTSGFRVAFLVAAGFSLAGAVVALVGVPRIPRRRAGAGAVAPAESA